MSTWLLVALLVLMPALTFGQETREEAIAAEQREKATRLAPYVPNRAERLLKTMREALVEVPSGFYPYFGSVYSGGGFTLGAGYRQFTGDRTFWSTSGLYSLSAYKLIQVNAVSPGHASGRFDLSANAGWRDATQVAYHGLGIDSPADTDTRFRMQQLFAGGDVTVRPLRFVVLTAGAAYEDYTLKDPTGNFTSVEAAFDPVSAPGVGVDPSYLHATTSAAFDWRPAAGYARRGGLYQVSRHDYADRDSTFSFDRLDVELVQHVPILRENWVLSMHGRLETTLGDDDQVPYFLLPSLGSGSTLRGYSSWRFRDRHAVLTSAEWRWMPSRLAIDMALFYDTGMVASRLDAISVGSFVSNYGIGIRFHSPTVTPLRIELARGDEGTQIVFAGSAAF